MFNSEGEGETDNRLLSVGAAVEFATTNNLLGIFVDDDLLVNAGPHSER
jgi:hypothetical protein